MTDTQLSFKRYEQKYLVPADKFEPLWERLGPRLVPDRFFESCVLSLYYDDESFSMIRSSIEKPVYKEKLRLRSYGVPGADSEVFVELKKKYKGLVQKRRVLLNEREATDWLAGGAAPGDTQIVREIDWVLRKQPLRPAVLIACDRRAYVAREDEALRVTVDSSVRWRDTELSLSAGAHGEELLHDGEKLVELKLPQSTPLWLAELLSECRVFPTGFSKYGSCYTNKLISKYFTVTE